MSHGSNAAGHAGNHGHVGHIVPVPFLAAILGGLLVLTAVTYGLGFVKLGALNIWVAMIIATVKASLVVLFFMHLRWDRPFNAIIFIGSLIFVTLFVALSLADMATNKPTVWRGEAPAVLKAEQDRAAAKPATPAAATPAH